MFKQLWQLLFTGLLVAASIVASAQTPASLPEVVHLFRGQALQADSTGLSFAVVTDTTGRYITTASADGFFSFQTDEVPGKTFCLHHPELATTCFTITAPATTDTTLLVLAEDRPLSWLKQDHTEAVVASVLQAAPAHEPLNQEAFSYEAYNKLTVSLLHNPFRKNAPAILRKVLPFLRASSEGKHHLFISESVTRREYIKEKQDRETILASRSSGIRNASYAALATQFQFFSVFSEQIKLANFTFTGPFTARTVMYYDFLVTGIFPAGADTVFVLRFEPKPGTSFEGLAGFAYVRSGAITHLQLRHASKKNPEIRIYQQLSGKENQARFPVITRSTMAFRRLGSRRKQVQVDFTSVLSDLEIRPAAPATGFDEVWITVQPDAEKKPAAYWQQHRQLPYTRQDKLTEAYFDSAGKLNDFEQYVRLVEKVRSGTVPFHFFDIKLRYLLTHNNYEGLRIGFGGETNEQLFDRLSLLGYVGYGFEDRGFKYGTGARYYLDKYRQNNLTFMHRKDVEEAGAVVFPFDRKQFSSEHIRKFLVSFMNLYTENRLAYENRSLPHLSVTGYVSANEKTPSFAYFYKGAPDTGGRYFDAVLGLRFGYKEKYILTENRKISIRNEVPVVALLLTKSFAGVLGSDYEYRKIDAKFENAWRVFPIGVTTIQVAGGKVFGQIPYANLYNGNGSRRVPSVVIHNSFETMNYNEFLSSEYVAFFGSHNFGKFLLQKEGFQPTLEVLHNMGWGRLQHETDFRTDTFQPFKTMEKGYYESGFFLNDLFVVRSPLLDTGVGAGFFFRYGPYAYDRIGHNIFFKFSVYAIL